MKRIRSVKKLPRRLLDPAKYRGYIFVLVFALTGAILLFVTKAATPVNNALEPEDGNRSANAVLIDDPTASGLKAVRFDVATPPPSGNVFSDTFGDLSHWTFGHWTEEKPGHPRANSTGAIVNGRAVITTADQNYGDATLRADRLYDVRNGGTFTFDVSLKDGDLPNTGAFIGYPFVAFADQPVNAPSYYDDNGKGTGLRNGGYYQFIVTCALPWQTGHARQFNNYAETVRPGEDNCLGQVTLTDGQLNRVELRYDGNDGWEFWASNAGTTAPLTKLRAFTMQIPEIGYFLLGSHNHASLKYSNGTLATANATFDNVSYPAGGYSSSFRNGANVVKGAAVTAHVVFSGYYGNNLTGPYSVTVNGSTIQFTPFLNPSSSFHAAVELPTSWLSSVIHDGANTITVQGVTDVANLDLVLTRNTP